jgi:threonine synthase
MYSYSTNHSSPQVSLKQAVLEGLAPDKGLYMPEVIPLFSEAELSSLSEKPFYELAFEKSDWCCKNTCFGNLIILF